MSNLKMRNDADIGDWIDQGSQIKIHRHKTPCTTPPPPRHKKKEKKTGKNEGMAEQVFPELFFLSFLFKIFFNLFTLPFFFIPSFL